jgi:hypothetical protein
MDNILNFSVDDFCNWFVRGFEQFYSADEKQKSFQGCDIRLDLPLVPELDRVQGALPFETRMRFRQGLALVVRAISPSVPSYFSILYQAIGLAARIGAVEMLPVVHYELESGTLRASSSPENETARLAAWNFIASFATHPDAYGYLRAAYNRPDLDQDLFKLFFLAQCHARPQNFHKLFVEFVGRQRADVLDAFDWVPLVYSILNVIGGLQTFATQLYKLPYRPLSYQRVVKNRGVRSDDFSSLISRLFVPPESPFRLSWEAQNEVFGQWKLLQSDKFGHESAVVELDDAVAMPGEVSTFGRLLKLCETERYANEMKKTAEPQVVQQLQAVLAWPPEDISAAA